MEKSTNFITKMKCFKILHFKFQSLQLHKALGSGGAQFTQSLLRLWRPLFYPNLPQAKSVNPVLEMKVLGLFE